MNIQFETVRTAEFTMDCFRFGYGEQPLVILPGLSADSVMRSADAVANAYQALNADFTVYVLDRRKDLPPVYPVRDMARDTAAALRALGLRQVDLFGASQGGMIAMEIAIAQPDLVRKLVLGSTSARVTDEQFRTMDAWIQLAKSGNSAELFRAFGAAVYPQTMFEAAQAFFAEAANAVTEADLKRFVILAEGARNFDVTDDLKKIACPVLVLGAADDRVLGAQASLALAQRLPNAVLHMYDGYGHAAYDTAPDYKERIRGFLGEDIKSF